MALWGELIEKLIKLQTSYNENTHSVDTHA